MDCFKMGGVTRAVNDMIVPPMSLRLDIKL